MKPILRSPRWLLVVAAGGALLLPSASRAFPPAPPHTIYGQVRDEYGQPLTLPSAQIIFEATNGVQLAGSVAPCDEPGVNYRLNIPMDSGIAPDLYKPTALRPTVSFRIRVKVGAVTYLPMEMAANYANLGLPAQRTRIDLTLGEDLDNDGLPDAWQRLLRALLGPGALIGPRQDADGDGISNLDEYFAGTYAFDPADGFRLQLVLGAGGTNFLEFMVISPRTYTIYSSSNLEIWAPIEFKIPASGPAALTLPHYCATDIRTLQVEPILMPGATNAHLYFKVLAQ